MQLNAGSCGMKKPTLLQHHTEAELIEAILGIATSRNTISKAIKLLQKKGVITIHKNPVPRYGFDRTKHYLFHPEIVNEWLKKRGNSPHDGGGNGGKPQGRSTSKNTFNNQHCNAQNHSTPCSNLSNEMLKNEPAIPETTPEITSKITITKQAVVEKNLTAENDATDCNSNKKFFKKEEDLQGIVFDYNFSRISEEMKQKMLEMLKGISLEDAQAILDEVNSAKGKKEINTLNYLHGIIKKFRQGKFFPTSPLGGRRKAKAARQNEQPREIRELTPEERERGKQHARAAIELFRKKCAEHEAQAGIKSESSREVSHYDKDKELQENQGSDYISPSLENTEPFVVCPLCEDTGKLSFIRPNGETYHIVCEHNAQTMEKIHYHCCIFGETQISSRSQSPVGDVRLQNTASQIRQVLLNSGA